MLSLERQNELRATYGARRPGWQPASERFAALVRQHLAPNSLILDVGCGRGGIMEQLEHPLSRVIGIDPDWESLVEHRLPLPRAAALSSALPLAPGRFDLAYASWVLEHMAEPQADFQAINRVLKPGGRFIFITPNKAHPLISLNRLISHLGRGQRALVTRLYGRAAEDTFPAFYRANERRQLEGLADRTGFTLEHFEAISDPTYLAFNPLLFKLAIWLEEGLLAQRPVHLVGCLRKH